MRHSVHNYLNCTHFSNAFCFYHHDYSEFALISWHAGVGRREPDARCFADRSDGSEIDVNRLLGRYKISISGLIWGNEHTHTYARTHRTNKRR